MTKGTNLGVDKQTMPLRNPKGSFVQISNAIVNDTRLSFKARGILALLLSRSKNWIININEITSKSDKDGKRAIQSGFKELENLGYVSLQRIYDELTNQYKGMSYVLAKCIFLPQRPHFETAAKSDHRKLQSPQNAVTAKSDRRKTASHNKTKGNNTNNSNTKKEKHQQQQEGNSHSDVADASFKISFFIEKLTNNKDWLGLFVGQTISPDIELDEDGLHLLLLHFKKTSLKNDSSYPNIGAVKKHFTNWFNANLEKKALVDYIQAFKKKIRQVWNQIQTIDKKTESGFSVLLEQRCTSTKQVLEFQKKILKISIFYKNKIELFQDEDKKNAIKVMISDIEKLSDRINRGKKANKLSWFCQKNLIKTSNVEAPSNPNKKVEMNALFANLQNNFSCKN